MAIIKKNPIVAEIIEKWYELQDVMTYFLPMLNDQGTDVEIIRLELEMWLAFVKDFQVATIPTCKNCQRPILPENQVCSHRDFKQPCEQVDVNEYPYSYFDKKDKLEILKQEIALHKQRLIDQQKQIDQSQENIDNVFKSLLGEHIDSQTDDDNVE